MTHTPGPWRVWEATKESWEICEPSKPSRHSHFANVRVGNMWDEEGKANARLIAAAPDLLEALKEATVALDGIAKGEGAFKPIEQTIVLALEVISKAEGRS